MAGRMIGNHPWPLSEGIARKARGSRSNERPRPEGVLARLAFLLVLVAGCAGTPVTEGLPRGGASGEASTRKEASALDLAAQAAARRLEDLEQNGPAGKRVPARAEIEVRYEELLDRPGTPEERKPEILLRLAEFAYREDEAALRAAYEGGGEPEVAPRDRYARSVARFRELTERFPDSAQALTAFYNLGYLYGEQGDVKRSAQAYREVLRRDPATPYSEEIHMRLGEAAFDEGRFEDAADHYRAAAAGDKAEYLGKALYKLGWCHYNLEDYGGAIQSFARVMDEDHPSPDDLRRETLEIMAKAFLERGGLEPLEVFVNTRPKISYGPRLFLLLGNLYQDSSRFEEAVRVYDAGVSQYPTSAEALDLEQSMLSALLVLRDEERANARRVEWVDRYGPGSEWDRAHGAQPVSETRDRMVEEGLRLAAVYYHGRARRGEGGLPLAVGLYRRYLELYGDAEAPGYEMAYSYAQALKESGELAEAARWYRRVALSTDFTAHREDASYRRIEVLETLYREDPQALDTLVQAHEDYVSLNPESPLVPEVLFAEAERYFEAERYPESRAVLERVIDTFPDHALVPRAHALVARCQFREENYEQAEGRARQALLLGLSDGSQEDVRKLAAFSIFKQAEAREAEGDLLGANEHFLRLAKEFPMESAAELALYRTGENLQALGRDEDAAQIYGRLARSYRGSEYGRSALALSAELFSSLGEWQEAARAYEELYRSSPDGSLGADALFRAAQTVERGHVPSEAARLYAEFAVVYPQDSRVAEARFREAEALRAQGLVSEAEDRYRRAWDVTVAGEGEAYRAKAALALARLSLERFRGVELSGDVAGQLLLKEAIMAETLEYLGRAASMPYAESFTEALYLAGDTYEEMKEAILGSERPSDLTEEEREEYDFLLEEKAFPLEERAVDFYQRGLAAARKAGVHTPWVDAIYARLEVLRPWAYRRAEEAVVAWDLPALRGPREELAR